MCVDNTEAIEKRYRVLTASAIVHIYGPTTNKLPSFRTPTQVYKVLFISLNAPPPGGKCFPSIPLLELLGVGYTCIYSGGFVLIDKGIRQSILKHVHMCIKVQ